MTTIEHVRRRAEIDAKAHGYYLNPDPDFLNDLLEGLKQNEERYGYPSCPCRLAIGKFEFDRDIICPCDYRDPDAEEYGHCYCALYVRKDVFEGRTPTGPIPERRPKEKTVLSSSAVDEAEVEKAPETTRASAQVGISGRKMRMWYCKQCGYVCFREEPPYVCPICRAKKEMFAEMKITDRFVG